MFYVIQKDLFQSNENLIESLERLNLKYEIVEIKPFIDDIEFKTDRKDVFCFGGLKISRLYKQYGWKPGCLMTSNHDFNVYKEHYKENLLNYDSKIYKFTDDWDWKDNDFFIRPVLDTKVLVRKTYTEDGWKTERNHMLKDREKMIEYGHTVSFDENTEIQVASLKSIQKEFRFFIVGGQIITGSLYRTGCFINYSNIVDDGAVEFCKEMIKVFPIADAFVMDICLTDGEWKIIEVGCINCAGFYSSNIPSLLMALEDFFNYWPSICQPGEDKRSMWQRHTKYIF